MSLIQSFDIDNFPTTRYQGSKRKILDWIYEHLGNIEFESALDVFGGTGSVSYLLKRMGKSVCFNDKYRFNYLLGKAIIENDEVLLTQKDVDYLLNKHSFNTYYTTIQDNFSSIYYLDEENIWLDNLVSNIIQFENYNSTKKAEYKKAIAYYAVFQACLMKRPFNIFHRKNLYLRTNDVERSFGNKTTWERPFENLFKKFVNEANELIINTGVECVSQNKSAFDIDEIDYDLVYMDPPYITPKKSNETSDYLRCYHFLEGLSIYSNWENMIDHDTKNLRFKNTLESNDFKKSTVKDLLTELVEKFRDSTIVLSYKKGGVPSIEYLVETMREYKDEVEVHSQHYKYALNNQNGDASKNREVLIIGQ